MRVIGVLNRDGGTFKTTDMAAFAARAIEIFARHGHVLDARIVSGNDLLPALEKAAREGDILLAGGGDGTVSAAAAVAFRSGVPLAVLPAGTMNLFARSLHLPMALDAALEALAAGQVIAVDIATANGRPFVHQFSVGIHPKLVKLRESLTYKSRLGKMLASTRAALGVALRPPNFTTEVLTRDGLTRRRTAGITVSNNPFDEGHLPLADRLDRGVLGIYLIAPLNALGLAKLCVSMALGKFRSLPEIADREAREVTLRFPHRKTGAVAVIDGELVNLPGRVELRVHPGELRVVVPGAEAATGASVDVPALASA